MQMMELWDGRSVPRIGIGTWAAVAPRAGVTPRPSAIDEYPIERAGDVFDTLRPVAPGGQDRRLLAQGRNRVAISDCLAVAEFHRA
jgi:hypothetical protein